LRDTVQTLLQLFKELCITKTDENLILENILLLVDLMLLIEPYENMHEDLIKFHITYTLMDCMQTQENPSIIKGCALFLQKCSNYQIF
jgi:hypothetical protein